MGKSGWNSQSIISQERRRAILDKEVRNRMRKIYGFSEQKDEVKEMDNNRWQYPRYETNRDVSTTVLSLTTLFVGLMASLTSAAVLSYLIITGINLAALAWFYG